jgi:hypothetical protein
VINPIIRIHIHLLVRDKDMMVDSWNIYLVVSVGIGEPSAVIYSHIRKTGSALAHFWPDDIKSVSSPKL